MSDWNARRILKELADADRRRSILTSFLRHGEEESRELVLAQLARSLRFRPETLRKSPLQRKADLLATRISAPEFEEHLEAGLMTYHTAEKRELLAAFLDQWGIPHEHGSIEVEEYTPPTADQVRKAAETLEGQFEARDVAIYLASAGLLMGESMPQWRDATWPVVDEMRAQLG